MFEDAFALGRANQKTIELARRHCLNMTFTKWQGGGQGMAEQMSMLPIDSRQVSCLMARGNTAGMNLAVLARDFYERHCEGCPQHRPTGGHLVDHLVITTIRADPQYLRRDFLGPRDAADDLIAALTRAGPAAEPCQPIYPDEADLSCVHVLACSRHRTAVGLARQGPSVEVQPATGPAASRVSGRKLRN